jgi:hypothetical protein
MIQLYKIHNQNIVDMAETKVFLNRLLWTIENTLAIDRYTRVKELNYDLAEKIASMTAVNEYIGLLCRRLHSIYIRYGIDTSEMEPETWKNSSGQVETKHIEEIIRAGNLRERMTLLINAIVGNKRFLWCAIADAENTTLNQTILRERIHRLYLMTGMSDINAIAETFHDEASYKEITNILDIPHDGSVLLSRLGAWPMQEKLRSERPTTDRAQHSIHRRRIHPPLSKFEIDFIKKYNPDWNEIQSEYVTWETGLMRWVINPENFYSKLAINLNQEVISGPSRTTDAVLALTEIFNDFNLELTVLACAAFLCGAQHHSAWEVLLAALPFGLQYDSQTDAYEYFHNYLIPKHNE